MSEDKNLTVVEHLTELRTRLIIVIVAVVVGFIVSFSLSDYLFYILKAPIVEKLKAHHLEPEFQQLGFFDLVLVKVKLSFIFSLFVVIPLILQQVWAFVSPGLYEKERRAVLPIMVGVSISFFAGVLFCYYVMLPLLTDLFISYAEGDENIKIHFTVETIYSFSSTFVLVFGLIFQLPLVVLFISVIGIADYKKLIRFYRYFIVLSFVIAALFPPTDPFSQTLLALPLNVLYGVGVLLAYLFGKKTKQAEGNETRAS